MSILSKDFLDSESDFTFSQTVWLDFPKFCSRPMHTASEALGILVDKKVLVRVVPMASQKTMIIFLLNKEVQHLVFNSASTYTTKLYWKPEWAFLTLERHRKHNFLKIHVVDRNGKEVRLFSIHVGSPHYF